MNKLIQENRVGIFALDRGFLTHKDDEELRAFLWKFLIVRAESNFATHMVEYTAYSELFDSIPLGTLPPHYEVTLRMVDRGEDIPPDQDRLTTKIDSIDRISK